MKRFSVNLVALTMFLLSLHATCAAFSVTGKYVDKLTIDTISGDYCAMPTGSATATGVLALSNFDASAFTDSSAYVDMVLSNEDFWAEIYFDLSEATVSGTAEKPVITLTQTYDTMFSTTETLKVKLSFTTNTVTVSLNADYDAFSAELINNAVNEPYEFVVLLGDMTASTTVYLNAKTSTTTKDYDDQDSVYLMTASLSGVDDSTPPTIAFTSPAANYKTTNSEISVTGTVKDNIAISGLFYYVTNVSKLNGSEVFTQMDADLSTNKWSLPLQLTPGTNYLFVKASDTAGNVSTIKSRMFYYVKLCPLTLLTSGSGSVSGAVNNQNLELGKGYTLKAKASKDSIFRSWKDGDGDFLSTNASYTFTMTDGLILVADFIPNPFAAAKGTYNGLFYGIDTNSDVPVATNSGYMTFTLTTSGAFSGKITMLSGSVSISGKLLLTGNDTNTAQLNFSAKRSKLLNIQGNITCDLTGSGETTGTLWQETNGVVNTATFYGLMTRTVKKSDSGRYNLAITNLVDITTQESAETVGAGMGGGYGSIIVGTTGSAKLALTPADHSSAVSFSTSLLINDSFPVFIPLYKKTGLFMGWFDTVQSNNFNFQGTNLTWIRPAMSDSKFYTNSFQLTATAIASLYTTPKTGTNVLGWTDGFFQLGGTPTNALSYTAIGFNKNTFTYPSDNTNKLKLKLTTSSGLISGSYLSGKTTTSFKAVVLPGTGCAYGFVAGTNTTDWIILEPNIPIQKEEQVGSPMLETLNADARAY